MSSRERPLILHVTTVAMTLRFLRGQVSYMKSCGYDIQVASSPDDELYEFAEQEQVAVRGIPMQRRIAPLSDLLSLWRLWRAVHEIRPDIVHSHTPKGGLLGMIAASLTGVPVRCYHLRGLPMMSARGSKRALLRVTERLACALAHEVYAVSHSLRDIAIEERLCQPEKIRVLAGGSGNGVDSQGIYNPARYSVQDRQSRRSELGIPEDACVIGFVGRLVRDKGIVELWEAWQELRDERPQLHLLLIGPRETADAVPAEVLRGLDSDPRVHTVGFVASAVPYYLAMDMLTLPTYREGFPNVLLEAAAMQLPVVATRVTGCVDAVDHEQTGLLVPAKDSHSLAQALGRYIASPALRNEHGALSRQRVVKAFDQRRIWSELESSYAQQLGGWEPSPRGWSSAAH